MKNVVSKNIYDDPMKNRVKYQYVSRELFGHPVAYINYYGTVFFTLLTLVPPDEF